MKYIRVEDLPDEGKRDAAEAMETLDVLVGLYGANRAAQFIVNMLISLASDRLAECDEDEAMDIAGYLGEAIKNGIFMNVKVKKSKEPNI